MRGLSCWTFVSEGNKDRPESRNAFVAKCNYLLSQEVSVIIVDILAFPFFNLHNQLLRALRVKEGGIKETEETPLYCASYGKTFIESDEQKKFLEIDLAKPSPPFIPPHAGGKRGGRITTPIPTRPMECIEIDAYGLSAKKIIEQIREEVKLRDIENAIALVQLSGISRAAFNTLDFRSLSALFEKAFHVEYLPQFYSGVEIPDSIRLVKSMQEDFHIGTRDE